MYFQVPYNPWTPAGAHCLPSLFPKGLCSAFVATVDWGGEGGGDNLDDGSVDLLGVQVVVEYIGTCVQLIDLTTTIMLISNLNSEHLIFSLVHLWYC